MHALQERPGCSDNVSFVYFSFRAFSGQIPNYCSLFPDTDKYFGSLGSFFQQPLHTGSFEVNPPFDWQSMILCLDRIVEVRHAC